MKTILVGFAVVALFASVLTTGCHSKNEAKTPPSMMDAGAVEQPHYPSAQ